MHNQHAGLSQLLAAQCITQRHEQAARARLAHSAGRSRHRRWWRLARGWWRLARRPSVTTQPAVHPTQGDEPNRQPGWIIASLGVLVVLVLAAGVSGPAHILGPGYQDDPTHVATIGEFDERFLDSHAWPGEPTRNGSRTLVQL